MLVDELTSLYQRNKLKTTDLEKALVFLSELESRIVQNQVIPLESIDMKQLDDIIHYLVQTKENTFEHFVMLMRYFIVAKRNDLFIHMTQYTGSLGVIQSILNKLKKVVGEERSSVISQQIHIAILGTPLSQMPDYVDQLINLFQLYLSEDEIKKVLADNHHQIPKEAYLKEKVYYEQANSLDDYLKDLHQRNIEELKRYQSEKRIWYEQEINDQVIEFVSNNQEILSAVRENNHLLITKIPYDTKAYLEAKTMNERRYHACHCPFVKSILLEDIKHISSLWCHCSGGFTKYQFDILFDKDLKIELLSSPLQGDELCRFSISLGDVEYKG